MSPRGASVHIIGFEADPRNPGDPKSICIGYIDTEYRPLHSFDLWIVIHHISYSPVNLSLSETNTKATNEAEAA